jgi:hypothetical protein
MKTLSYVSRLGAAVFFLAAAVLFVAGGCSKSGGDPVGATNALGAGVVADLAAASLGGGTSTQGMTAQMEDIARYAGGGGFAKPSAPADLRPFDTTIVRDKSTGSVTYHYVLTYGATVSNLGNRLDVHYTIHGTLDTPRMSSADSAASTVALTHIVDPDSQYTVNSTYVRYGTQQSKTGEMVAFSSTTNAVTTNVKISKSTNEIQGGTATMTVAGQLSTGGGFSYTVTVTFLGNHQAMLLVNGSAYLADLSAGTATPAGE